MTKRPLPGLLDLKLIPPDIDYPYFQEAETHPFLPEEKEFHPRNLWWLSEASLLAYCHPQFARMALHIAGYPRYRFFQGEVGRALSATGENTTLVAFRGTEFMGNNTVKDVLTDLKFRQVPAAEGGRVHQGFQEALDNIWKGEDGLHTHLEMLLQENSDHRIWLTGHSLGGAMALLTASRFPRVQGVYTLGAPKAGNKVFSETISVPVYRIVHQYDPVPHLPPPLPLGPFADEDYVHSGTLYYFNQQGALSQPLTTGEKLGQTNLGSHAPLFYALHSWNLLAEDEA